MQDDLAAFSGSVRIKLSAHLYSVPVLIYYLRFICMVCVVSSHLAPLDNRIGQKNFLFII